MMTAATTALLGADSDYEYNGGAQWLMYFCGRMHHHVGLWGELLGGKKVGEQCARCSK